MGCVALGVGDCSGKWGRERKEFKVNLGIVLACVVAQPALAKTFMGGTLSSVSDGGANSPSPQRLAQHWCAVMTN